MKVTKAHVPPRPARSAAADTATAAGGSISLWIGLLAGGATLAIIGAIGFSSLGVLVGIVAVAVAGARIGLLEGRRSAADPRVAALTRERDQWKELGERLLAGAQRDRGSAPAGDGGGQPQAAPAARPSASVRGGGRPGAVAGASLSISRDHLRDLGRLDEAAHQNGVEP